MRLFVCLIFIVAINLTSKYFFQGNSTQLSNGTCITHFTQSLYRSLHKIVRIGRALRLSQDILHTYTFKNGTHCTASYDTSTLRGRAKQNLGTAELCNLLMRDRTLNDRNLDQIFLGGLYALRNCSSNFSGLTKAITNDAFSIAYYYNSSKRESTATLSYLDYAIDSNQSIFQLFTTYVYSVCHNLLKFKSAITSSISDLFDTSMVQITISVKNDSCNSSLQGFFSNNFTHFGSLLSFGQFLHTQ